MKKYPFKFLDAYGKEDKDIFFGREAEIDELYRLVFQTNLLLVYGASGTGKTSLIRCGLSNRFKSTQWLDLYIRRGSNINQSLLDTVLKNTPQLVATTADAEEELDWFENLIDEEADTTENQISDQTNATSDIAKALNELYLATFTPIYLIFDQFEELFTLGKAEEQQRFTATIKELVQLALPLKIIIVMREEYLAKLYDLEKAVPQLRNKKLRVEAMDLPRVEQVILNATLHNPNSNISLEQGEETAIAQGIIERIREGDVNVKLPYLQVFMDRLYQRATGLETDRTQEAHFSLSLVEGMGAIGDILKDFIDQQSLQIHSKLSQKFGTLPTDMVWQILSPFATVDGTKVPIPQDRLESIREATSLKTHAQGGNIIKMAIAELETSRILRFRKEEGTYEVVHDTLALQISEKRSEEEKAYLKAKRMVTEGFNSYQDTQTYLSREQLAFVNPYEERILKEINPAQQHFLLQSKSVRKRQRILLWSGIAGAFAIAIAIIVVVLGLQRNTQDALDDALAAQAAREKTELSVLLQNTTQISKGNNCPPAEMRNTMDSLYQKHKADLNIKANYEATMKLIPHCN